MSEITKAVFLSYASHSFAEPTEGSQDGVNRKERKEHKEVRAWLDQSLRSLRSVRLTSVA